MINLLLFIDSYIIISNKTISMFLIYLSSNYLNTLCHSPCKIIFKIKIFTFEILPKFKHIITKYFLQFKFNKIFDIKFFVSRCHYLLSEISKV